MPKGQSSVTVAFTFRNSCAWNLESPKMFKTSKWRQSDIYSWVDYHNQSSDIITASPLNVFNKRSVEALYSSCVIDSNATTRCWSSWRDAVVVLTTLLLDDTCEWWNYYKNRITRISMNTYIEMIFELCDMRADLEIRHLPMEFLLNALIPFIIKRTLLRIWCVVLLDQRLYSILPG